jgi:hypothetical protein
MEERGSKADVLLQKAKSRGAISNHTSVVRVTDLDLAVALFSVGVPLREDPPYTAARLKNGEIRWVFNFLPHTSDKKKKTMDLVNGYAQSDKYIAENPVDIFTGAMCALRNRSIFVERLAKVKPWVAFRSPTGQSTVQCIEGSKRHENYLKKGWVRCDPFEDQKPKG